MNIHLSVIVPAYNEERRISKTLGKIDKYLSKQSYSYEIIVASDGSKDKTGEVVKGLMSKIKNLRLIDNKENHGKGYVVRQGLLEAKGDYRLFTDADNSTSIDQVEKMWPLFEKGYEVIIGSREIKGAVLDPPQPQIRRIVGAAFRFFTNIFTGLWAILDTQCGFKGFTKKAAEDILPKCVIDRFSFDPEILILAKKFGYKIKEIPVIWKNDLESKVKFKNMVKMGFDLIKIRMNLIKRIYG
jgi:dolichyl-phosphate beta-glucosyltransferase